MSSMVDDNYDDEPFYGRPRNSSSSSQDQQQQHQHRRQRTVQERIAIALHSATTAFMDPTRAEQVAALGDITSPITLRRLYAKMMSDPTGRMILQDRPIVSKSTIPYERLISEASNIITTINSNSNSNNNEDDKKQPSSLYYDGSKDDDITFGQAYGLFLLSHGFDPDGRDQVKYVQNDDLAYIMLRYRQCHDYWHALTGLPPTVVGELGIKWLELFHTGLPVAALSATIGSLRLHPTERNILFNHYLPWAAKQSSSSSSNSPSHPPFLMNVYYEKEFDTPLQELRNRLQIEAAPRL